VLNVACSCVSYAPGLSCPSLAVNNCQPAFSTQKESQNIMLARMPQGDPIAAAAAQAPTPPRARC